MSIFFSFKVCQNNLKNSVFCSVLMNKILKNEMCLENWSSFIVKFHNIRKLFWQNLIKATIKQNREREKKKLVKGCMSYLILNSMTRNG